MTRRSLKQAFALQNAVRYGQLVKSWYKHDIMNFIVCRHKPIRVSGVGNYRYVLYIVDTNGETQRIFSKTIVGEIMMGCYNPEIKKKYIMAPYTQKEYRVYRRDENEGAIQMLKELVNQLDLTAMEEFRRIHSLTDYEAREAVPHARVRISTRSFFVNNKYENEKPETQTFMYNKRRRRNNHKKRLINKRKRRENQRGGNK